MKLNPNIAARERNHATQPGRAGSPLPAAKGDKVSALPASSRRRARSVAPYPRLNSLRAAKILPPGWSAGLQPAFRSGTSKAGCKPALQFGCGFAALRSFVAIAASFLFAGTVAHARRRHHSQSVPAVAGPADEGLTGGEAMGGSRPSQCAHPTRLQDSGEQARCQMRFFQNPIRGRVRACGLQESRPRSHL